MRRFSAGIAWGKESNRKCVRVFVLSRVSWLSLLLASMAILSVASEAQEKRKNNDEDPAFVISPWQRCSVFVAPTIATSKENSMNWGVYANRDFSEGEIVDISPLTVPIPDGSESIERSVLNDYVYGYWRVFEHPQMKGKHSISKLYSVLFGPDMFYNHHPVAPNVQFSTFGREPEAGIPNAVNPQGFVATRRIRRGEELFSSYNGKEDGGTEWFRRRGIHMETPSFPASPLLNNVDGILDKHSEEFCSKIYSGVGLPSWRDRLLPLLPTHYELPFFIDLKWLAPSFDAGWGDARTKVDVSKGERLEISTALVLSREFTEESALMPLVYSWKDLDNDHREGLRSLARKGQLHLQYQGPNTSWKPMNNFTQGNPNSFEDLVLFPVAGHIGMVRRRNASAGIEANCRLVLHPQTNQDATGEDVEAKDSMLWLEKPVGVTIELVTTQDMAVGTLLVVDLEETVASPYEYNLLLSELKSTGQPFAREVFRDLRHGRVETEQDNTRVHTTTKRSASGEL